MNGVGSGGTLPQIERGLGPQALPLDSPLLHSGSRSVDSSLNRGHRVVYFSKTPYSHMIVSLQLTELSLVAGGGVKFDLHFLNSDFPSITGEEIIW